MSSPDRVTRFSLRRLGLMLLVLCAVCLALENTLLFGLLALTKPSAAVAVLAAAFKVGSTLAVPLWMALIAAWLGWSWSGREMRSSGGTAIAEVRHE